MRPLDYLQYPVLVVDDEQDNLDAFRFAFRRSFSLHYALGGEGALEALGGVRPAVVVCDQRMPGMDGIAVLEEVQRRRPDTAGILLTAYTDLPVLLAAIHSGVVHRYVQKPWDSKELALILRQAIERYAVLDENRRLREQLARYAGYLERERHDPLDFGVLLGDSQAIRHLHERLAQVAPAASAVLLRGERGTGKRTVALALHTQSEREGRPFVELDASEHGPEAQVRELAGWQTGAVPGGLGERAGRLELAHGGTLYVAHVEALGPEAQALLLRALEHRHVARIGSAGPPLAIDVRLVASTGVDLGELEARGAFLPALRGRLEVFPLLVPALRDRRDDLPRLCDHVLVRLSRRNGRAPRSIAAPAMVKLLRHDWPDNLRELEGVLERAALSCRAHELDAAHVLVDEPDRVRRGPAPLAPSVADGTASRIDLPERLEELERRELLAALERCQGNKAEVARMLGVQRTTLYYRLKRLGIDA